MVKGMERSVKRQVLAALIRAGRRDLAYMVADHVPVDYFITYLSSKYTQWDKRLSQNEMKRGGRPNIYRLGHIMGAVNRIRDAVKPFKQSTDPADFEKLKAAIMYELTDETPRRATLKAIDQYLQTGKRPKLTGR